VPPGPTLGIGSFENGGNIENAAQIIGTPTTVGAYDVLLRAEDGAGHFGQRNIRIRVTDLAFLAFTPNGGMPNAFVNQSYSQNLTAQGGSPPYNFRSGAAACSSRFPQLDYR
jgi:hypothetical protein